MSALHGLLAMGRARIGETFTETIIGGRFVRGTLPDGSVGRTLAEKRYEGRGRVKYTTLVVQDGKAAGELVAAQSVVVKIPADSPLLVKGDEFEVVTSTVDGSLVGRHYRVDGAPQAGQVTAHRYPVTEVS